MTHSRSRLARGWAGALAVALLTGCASLSPFGSREAEPAPPPTPRGLTLETFLESPHGKYVLVDVAVNRLHFMDGRDTLWSAKVGTGTGLRLEGSHGEWEFSTPTGVYFVEFKELDPVWYLPDWYFLERKLPVPPAESPKRKRPNELGEAAVYFGPELAIHGTDKPELLGKRVSHGCIRLANRDVKRLFHNVQVGTPVLIVGKAAFLKEEFADSALLARLAKRKPTKAPDPLAKLSTAQLLQRLDGQLRAPDGGAAWTATAHALIRRGIKDDATALRGLLSRAGASQSARTNREYATFVADAFARGPLRAVVSLARIDAAARERAAQAIVTATMDLYAGSLVEAGAPWPTRRVPLGRLGPEGQSGWKALQKAEAAYREEAPSERLVMGGGLRQ